MSWFFRFVEVASSVIEILVMFRLFDFFFEKKHGKAVHICLELLCTALITALTIWLNAISLYSYLTAVIILSIVAASSKLLCRCSFISALSITVVCMLLINALDFLTLSVAELLFGVNGVTIEVMTTVGAYRCALIIGMKTVLVLLYILFVHAIKPRIQFNNKVCATVIVSGIFCFFCMQKLIEAVIIGNISDMRKAVLVAWLFIILFIVSFMLLLKYNAKLTAQKLTNSIIETRLEVLEADSKAINNAYSDLAKMAHDFKKHIAAISVLAQNQKYDALAGYLAQMEQDAENIRFISHTGVESVDAVLNSRLSAAQKNGVELTIKATPLVLLSVRDMDLCAIAANLLDNAIEACMKVEGAEMRTVRFTISSINSMIIIKVKNPYVEVSDKQKAERIAADGHMRGYGLQIIKTLAEKYDGTYTATTKDNAYIATVMLANYN